MDTDSSVQCWLRNLHLSWRHPCFAVDSARWTQKAEHLHTSLRIAWQHLQWAHFREEPQCLCWQGQSQKNKNQVTTPPYGFSELNQEALVCEHNSKTPSFLSFLVEQHFWIHIQTYFKRLSSSYKPFLCLILLSSLTVSLLSLPVGCEGRISTWVSIHFLSFFAWIFMLEEILRVIIYLTDVMGRFNHSVL